MSIIITAEVWQYAPVGNGDLLVLLRIADAAGDDHRMMWESARTLAKRTRMSERSVYNCLRNLEKKNVIETVPKEEAPPEATLYASVVRRIRPVADWLEQPPETDSSGEVGMQNLHDPNPGKNTLKNLHPEDFSYNPVITTTNRVIEKTTSSPPRHPARSDSGQTEVTSPRPGGKGWEAVQPLRRGGRKKTRKQEALEREQAEREMDPAYVVAQALGEDDPETCQDGRLPASDDDLAPPARQGRKPRSLRPSEVLASFFDERAQDVGHPVPGATNFGALSGNFGRWMAQGTDKDEIRQMIITYWSSSWQRSENVVAWKDFLSQRGLLTDRAAKVEKVNHMEKHRYDENYWS